MMGGGQTGDQGPARPRRTAGYKRKYLVTGDEMRKSFVNLLPMWML